MTHDESSDPETTPNDDDTSIDEPTTTDEAVEAPVSLSKVDDPEATASGTDDASADEKPRKGKAAKADDDEPSARKPMASLALAAAVAALIAAIVCLGYFGYTGIRAYTVDSDRAQMRTGAVDGAEQAIINTLSIDPAKLNDWEERVKSSLTGQALEDATADESRKILDEAKKAAAKGQGATISIRIIRSAPTQMNTDENTVEVLVLAAATSSASPEQPTALSNLLTMVEDDGTWKATKIVPLTEIYYSEGASPVGTAPGAPADQPEGGN